VLADVGAVPDKADGSCGAHINAAAAAHAFFAINMQHGVLSFAMSMI
jgi:hypothetical protein